LEGGLSGETGTGDKSESLGGQARKTHNQWADTERGQVKALLYAIDGEGKGDKTTRSGEEKKVSAIEGLLERVENGLGRRKNQLPTLLEMDKLAAQTGCTVVDKAR